MDYKYVKNSPQKYKDIKQLKLRSMGLDEDLTYINSKYDTSIFGSRDIGFFAEDENNFPAAYYGVFPIRATYNGEHIIIAQSGDTMTDPDHRKRGLFTKLAKETYSYAGKNNISFVFGFPNKFSYPGFKKKLDWKFFGNMHEFIIKTNSFPLCELSKKYPALKNIYRKLLDKRIGKYKLDINEQNIKPLDCINGDFHVVRDINFYKYKEGVDKYLVKLNGFTLFVRADIHLFIGDVSYFEADKLDLFISTIKQLSKITMSLKVILIVSKKHWLHDLLEKSVTPKESLPIGFYTCSNSFEYDKMVLSVADYDTF